MNINEMCAALSVSTKTGYKLLKEGRIPAMKVGRTYRIPKVRILEYMMIVEQEQTRSSTPLHAANESAILSTSTAGESHAARRK